MSQLDDIHYAITHAPVIHPEWLKYLRASLDLTQNEGPDNDGSITEREWYKLREVVVALEAFNRACEHYLDPAYDARPSAYAQLDAHVSSILHDSRSL